MEASARRAGCARGAHGVPIVALALVAALPHCIDTYSLRDAGRADGGVVPDVARDGGVDGPDGAPDAGDPCDAGLVRCDAGCVDETACPRGKGLYLPLDEGSGTTAYDRTGNGNDGTFSAPTDPQWQPASNCRAGSCLYFNGTSGSGDKVDVAYGSSLRFGTADFTVSAWVRVDPGSAGTRTEIVVGTNRGGVHDGWFLAVWFGQVNFATYGPGSANALVAPQRVDDGAWHQIAGRRRGTTVQVLVDGVVANAATVAAGYNSDTTGTVLELGNQPQGTDGPPAGNEYQGYIDDVRIYGTTDPSAALCPTGKSTCVSGPIGAWSFNGNANDGSGNGHNGTVFGATPTTDRSGNPNGAYAFNGASSRIVMNVPGLPQGNAPRTVSIWYKTLAFTSQFLVSYGGMPTGQGFGMYAGGSSAIVLLAWDEDSNAASTVGVADGTWHDAVVMNDGTTTTLWRDGVYLTRVTEPIDTTGTQLLVGARPDLSTWFWNGSLDDVRVWDRTLSSDELAALYAAGPQ